jgi:hypothetical protein
MQEVDNIYRILEETKEAVKSNDSYQLKNLSNQTIHSAAIHQDPDNLIVAVLVYSLGKIIERQGFKNMQGWDIFYDEFSLNLDKALVSLKEEDLEKFRICLGKIRNSLNKISGDLSNYIRDVFYKAEINKAFKIYEHGLSSEKTASLLGVSLWDLSSYIGQSTVSESHFNEAISVKERVKLAEQITKSKVIILDSGPIISITLSGLHYVLKNLKQKFPQISFIMTPQVKKEVIDKALTIKKYELEAVKVQNMIDEGTITLSTKFVSNNQLEKETSKILSFANSTIKSDGDFVKIVQEGEASCLAFANLCGCNNLIAIDERTTRLLTESPENLRAIMERKLHMEVFLNKKNLKPFEKFEYIRSSELIFIAYKNNLTELKQDKVTLDAILYSLKYSGASISSKEIEEIKTIK